MISSIVRMLSCSRFDSEGGTMSRERVDMSLVLDKRCASLGREGETAELDREADGRLRPTEDDAEGCDEEVDLCDRLLPLGWPELERKLAAFSRRWRSSHSSCSLDFGGFSPLSRPGSALVTSRSFRSVRWRSRTKSCCCRSRSFSRS
jgi:hypothetical protein